MLLPHLIFSHLVADYVFQTNWIVQRKHQGLRGLIIHVESFFIIALFVLLPYLKVAFLPVCILSAEHVLQDWTKIKITRRFSQYARLWYLLDQVLHITGAIIVSRIIGSVDPKPENTTLLLLMLASSVIVLTNAWAISIRVNWPSLKDYIKLWLWWGYFERLTMLLVISLGGVVLLPLALACTAPRLVRSYQLDRPIWKDWIKLLELSSGVVASTILGLGIWNLLQYI